MGSRLVATTLLLAGCKAELGGDALNAAVDAAAGVDSSRSSSVDAAMVDAPAMLGPWGTPALVPGASSASVEDDVTLSSDKLELYFKRVDVATAPQDHNIYVMKRASASAAWSTPVAVTAFNTTGIEETPRLTADDLTMYFGRAGDIYKSTRASTASAWGTATLVTELSTTAYEKWAAVCNGYVVISRANGTNGQDLYEGTLGQTLTPMTAMNTTKAEQGTFLTSDCLRLYFQSNRDTTADIYMASRATTTSTWSAPAKLADFNTTMYGEEDAWISSDERTFAFASNAAGTKDIYIVTR